jgi:cell division protein FtsL
MRGRANLMLHKILNIVLVLGLVVGGFFYLLKHNETRQLVAERDMLVAEVAELRARPTKIERQTIVVKEPGGTETTTIVEQIEAAPCKPQLPASRDLTRYRLDVAINPLNYQHIYVGAGARLGNLPAFATLGTEYISGKYNILLGIGYEF